MTDRPRIALFLFDCRGEGALARTLERLPTAAGEWLEEVVVMCARRSPDSSEDCTAAASDGSRGSIPVTFHKSPRTYGFGGDRKAAFEYALRRGLDFVVFVRADGRHPTESLCELVAPVLAGEEALVIAARPLRLRDALAGRASPSRALGHALSTSFQNRVLALRLRDYQSSFRVYPVRALERIPFQSNSNDRRFDAELLIQFRALGVPVREVEARHGWREAARFGDRLRAAAAALSAALAYRLHQFHVIRRSQYFVDRGTRYTLKLSPTGSHMQFVHTIKPRSSVLDLGCSQGLLARPLGAKGVRVTGVDSSAPESVVPELAEYFQRDLEQVLELPTGRVFDYVLVADVIEHLRNRVELLRSARRFLKPSGRLLISTPNIALWFYRLSLLVGRFEYGPRGVLDATHVHLYTRASFRREVEKAGFHVLRESVTSLPFEVVFESTGRSRLVRWLSAGTHRLARLWPGLFAYQFILEAEITTLDEDATPD